MGANDLKKRTPQERLIIAKTLLETVLDDMPFVEKAQLSEEGTTFDIPSTDPKTPSNGSITSINPENTHDRTTGDLISRQEATTIPVMPVEHREYQTMNLDDAYEQGWFDCQKCIEELPSVEPTIIRCRDCKHHDGIRCFRWNSTIITGFDDFCSNAEKRGEEDE